MKVQAHSLQIKQEARFFTLGELRAETPRLWMVCHGYGQLAPYFLRHFQVLADAGHFVVAPEGLSHFYLKGFSGRVGASWMTKETREMDIKNYVSYLSTVHQTAFKGHSAPLNLLGFSQGVATICRWGILSGISFDELILWAGIFPPDLPIKSALSQIEKSKVTIVMGNEDPFIDKERGQEQLNVLNSLSIKPRLIEFSGKHELNPEVLKTYFLK